MKIGLLCLRPCHCLEKPISQWVQVQMLTLKSHYCDSFINMNLLPFICQFQFPPRDWESSNKILLLFDQHFIFWGGGFWAFFQSGGHGFISRHCHSLIFHSSSWTCYFLKMFGQFEKVAQDQSPWYWLTLFSIRWQFLIILRHHTMFAHRWHG